MWKARGGDEEPIHSILNPLADIPPVRCCPKIHLLSCCPNVLPGSIPKELGKLKVLKKLDLSHNALEGGYVAVFAPVHLDFYLDAGHVLR